MDFTSEEHKINLIEWISKAEDIQLIEHLIQFKKAFGQQFSDKSISKEEIASIDKGNQDIKDRKLTSHNEVKKMYAKWL